MYLYNHPEKNQTLSQRKLIIQTLTHQTSTNRFLTTTQLQITIISQFQTIRSRTRHLPQIVNRTLVRQCHLTYQKQQTRRTHHHQKHHSHIINIGSRSAQLINQRRRCESTRILQKYKVAPFGIKLHRKPRSFLYNH